MSLEKKVTQSSRNSLILVNGKYYTRYPKHDQKLLQKWQYCQNVKNNKNKQFFG